MRHLFFILCLASALVQAQTQAPPSPQIPVPPLTQADRVNLQFNEIKLTDLIRLLFTDILRRNYVLDRDLLDAPEVMTVDIRDMSKPDLEKHLLYLISRRGFHVEDRKGLLYIGKHAPQAGEKDVYIFRPLYRSVSYLMDLAGPLFPREAFTTNRKIDTPDRQDKQASTQTTQTTETTSMDQETGTNATSLIDKADTDTIVYLGTPQEIQRLDKLFRQLDTPTGEVLVKAVVYEVRQERSESNAVTLALGLLKSASGAGISITQNTDTGNAIKIKAGDVSAIWSALAGDGRFKLVSSPTVRVRSGGTARFMAGSEVPVLASTTTTTTGTVQSVEYKNAGVILKLVPTIREGSMDLTITQEVSSFTPTTNGVNNSPTLLKRELSTAVTASGDEVIVLGGLDEASTSASTSGLSFLPAWLHGRAGEDDRTEIMMMLHVKRI